MTHARFVRVALNGIPIHENITVTGPTRASAFQDEASSGPVMFQGDHGPVALRNIRVKHCGQERLESQNITHRVLKRQVDALPETFPEVETPPMAVVDLADHRITSTRPVLVAYEGLLQVPTIGVHHFAIVLDWITGDPHFRDARIGGAQLRVGDTIVLRHDSNTSRATGSVNLAEGTHAITIVYFKKTGGRPPGVTLEVTGPNSPLHFLMRNQNRRQEPAPIYLHSDVGPVMHRSFVSHGRTKRIHAISAGDPEGVHYSLDR